LGWQTELMPLSGAIDDLTSDVTPPTLSEAYTTAAMLAGKHVTLTQMEGRARAIVARVDCILLIGPSFSFSH
jgi:hypothetical protein